MGEPALAASLAGRNFVADKAEVRRTVEAFLDSTFNKQPGGEVARAARYAVGGPAHRWRAIVAVARDGFFRDDALTLVLPSACGVSVMGSRHRAGLLVMEASWATS